MPNEVKYEDLTQTEINDAWSMMRNGPLYVVLKHRFKTAIDEKHAKYHTIDAKDFESHRCGIKHMEDLALTIEKQEPPTK